MINCGEDKLKTKKRNMKPPVSAKVWVAIVTYNASKYINKCLDSLLDSSVPCNVVIVDNSSTDDTVDLIHRHPKEVKVITVGKNLGFGQGNNLCFQYALAQNADYVFLLNQDAYIVNNTLEELLKISYNNPEYYILSPLQLNGNGESIDFQFSYYLWPPSCNGFYSDFVLGKGKDLYELDFANAAMWLVKKDCFLKIGGFDPIFFHYGEDNDFVNRVKYSGYKIGICPKSVGFHDRPQQMLTLSALPIRKRLQRRVVPYLIIMMDLNKTYGACVLATIKELTGQSLRRLEKFEILNILIEIVAFFNVFFLTGTIINKRKVNREEIKGPTHKEFSNFYRLKGQIINL
jgi:GT2 family glycosyltransferase